VLNSMQESAAIFFYPIPTIKSRFRMNVEYPEYAKYALLIKPEQREQLSFALRIATILMFSILFFKIAKVPDIIMSIAPTVPRDPPTAGIH